MQANLSPSVNIIRDSVRPFRYFPTANSRFIFEQIATAFKSGVRTFSIVGSYGTGKSAFLLGLINHFTKPLESTIFQPINGQFNGLHDFEIISIVGESRPFQEVLGEKIGASDNEKKTIFTALKKKRDWLSQNEKCCIIIVDEFGKFLEYAAKHTPSVQLYFLQELAEFVNDPDKNFLFISTLHQNFDAYLLGETERKEWEKVKGRFKELTFNEPVEQLLHLASDFIVEETSQKTKKADSVLLDTFQSAGIFRFQKELTEDFAQRIYPFDVLSAMCLTVALQRYGQNERSLFSFLTTDEHLGLKYFLRNQKNETYLNLAWVYDYLIFNFHSVITSKQNVDFFKWLVLRNTLERVYTHCNEEVAHLLELAKTIGLLEILGSDAAIIDTSFLVNYGQIALNIRDVEPLIRELEEKKIILFQSFKKRFKLFEGTDENLEKLLEREKSKIDVNQNLIPELKKYVSDQYHIAKEVSYKTGTTRVFEVKISDNPLTVFNENINEIDGFVNFVFSNHNYDFSEIGINEPILYGVYNDFEGLRTKIRDIQATLKAIDYVRVKNDTVGREELEQWLSFHLGDLNETINIKLFGKNSSVEWFYDGCSVVIPTKSAFNQKLSKIAKDIYPATPEYRNELINKVNYTNNINLARKGFFSALYEQPFETNFGFDKKQMPPEKMIYLTLCKHTKLFDTEGETFVCRKPISPSFQQIWEVSIDFLDSTITGKRPLSELIEKLQEKPFRLKKGFIDFWILAFVRGHREDIAVFKNGTYLPKVGQDVAELFFREAKNFEIKKFSIEGVRLPLFNKYRELTKQAHQVTIKGSGFQETAKPFIVFYNKLPKFTQQTKQIGLDCIAFVKCLKNAKDLDKLFFEDLPIAFGTSLDRLNESEENLNDFIKRIEVSISELRLAYDSLVDKVEDYILDILGIEKTVFEIYRPLIETRYAKIKEYLLHARQKSFLNRIKLPLDDKKAWINSLSQVVMNKQLSEFTDEEVTVFFYRLADSFKELDDLLIFNSIDFDNEKEQAYSIEITGSDTLKIKKNVILTKKQDGEAKHLSEEVEKILKQASPSIYDAVLIRLLKNSKNDKD